jgi:hypothetical protein
MALLFNKICLRALFILSISLVSASAQVVAPVRIKLTMVHVSGPADRPADLSGFVKAPKDGVVGVMSLAKAQALLSKTPVRDSLELGTVQLSSGRATVVEKMQQVDAGKKSRSAGVRVGVKSTHTSTGAVCLELRPEIIGWDGAESEAGTGHSKPSVRKLGFRRRMEVGQTVLAAFPPTEETQVVTDSVPFLGDLPLIGRLFRTVRHQRYRSQDLLLASVRP